MKENAQKSAGAELKIVHREELESCYLGFNSTRLLLIMTHIHAYLHLYIFRVSCEICPYQFSLGLEPGVRVINSANYLALTLLPNQTPNPKVVQYTLHTVEN